MAIARKLEDDGWENAIAGYVADYLLCAVCVLCASHAAIRWISTRSSLELRLFLGFMILLGIAFLFGGITHHILYRFDEEDQTIIGRTWSVENRAWMYAWLIALSLAPLAAGLILLLILVLHRRPIWTAIFPAGLSIVIACVEIPLLAMAHTEPSGVILGLLAVFVYFSGSSLVFVGMIFEWVEGAAGGNQLLASEALALMGWLMSLHDAGPPWLHWFNHIAIVHALIVMSVVCLWWAVVLRLSDDDKPAPMYIQTQSAQLKS